MNHLTATLMNLHMKRFSLSKSLLKKLGKTILTPTSKSYGLSSCPTNVLKLCKEILSEPLSEIFNLSAHLGVFTKIIPVYKSEDESDPSNYRSNFLIIDLYHFEKIMNCKIIGFYNET